jgi:putative FmdB family regulatory protein
MPIYEFYCRDCHTLFNFLSRRVNTDKRPPCPRCNRELHRRVSLFAYSLGRQEDATDGSPGELNGDQLELAASALAGEMEGLDEEDPRQMARILRKLGEATGMPLGDGMTEAIHRLEAGEDPEVIEQQLGDLFEGEQPFAAQKRRGRKDHPVPPTQDDTLHIL